MGGLGKVESSTGFGISELSKTVSQRLLYHEVPELTLNAPVNSQKSRPCSSQPQTWKVPADNVHVRKMQQAASKSKETRGLASP